MHIICMTYAGRMPAPQLFSIFGLYDLAAHQLTTNLDLILRAYQLLALPKVGMPWVIILKWVSYLG
jgi:hypothetical protein